MNKNEAYQSMCQGHKVCNEYYSPEEYAFINDDGLIEYEDGCVVGDQFSENWVKYQDPECKFEWSIWKDKNWGNHDIEPTFPIIDPYLYTSKSNYISPIIDYPKPFVPKHSHKRSNKQR